jgi:hypothetical protein
VGQVLSHRPRALFLESAALPARIKKPLRRYRRVAIVEFAAMSLVDIAWSEPVAISMVSNSERDQRPSNPQDSGLRG